MGNVYQQEILEDKTICSNCFRKTHTEHHNRGFFDEDWPDDWRPIQPSMAQNLKTELISRPQGSERAAGREPTEGMKTLCKCGVFNNFLQQQWSRNIHQLIQMTHRLCERLDEKDIEHDTEKLYDQVRDLKTDQSEDYNFNEIFEMALMVSCFTPANRQ